MEDEPVWRIQMTLKSGDIFHSNPGTQEEVNSLYELLGHEGTRVMFPLSDAEVVLTTGANIDYFIATKEED